MSSIDWVIPETWNVGDTLNADLWTRRVYDPLGFLLRRPITELRRTTDLSVTASTTGFALPFDTITSDSDGLVLESTPVSNIYMQRSGVFDYYASAPFMGNGANGHMIGIGIKINGTSLRDRQGALVGTATTMDHAKSINGSVTLNEGDYLTVVLHNNSTSALIAKAQYNAPRLVILWKGPVAG